jgi:GT2 family glycosyltransferase
MAISAVINQTKKIDNLILYDDNDPDKRVDLRDNSVYARLFQIIDAKGIEWQVIFGTNKGQHHGHQIVQSTAKTDWIWRVDDDTIPEPNVLEELCTHIQDDVAAVGGAVLTPPMEFENIPTTGKIENIYNEPNIQWSTVKSITDVDHLHCTFIYRRGIQDYNLGLSRVAHREETLFTYGLKQKGHRVLAVPNATFDGKPLKKILPLLKDFVAS